VFCFLVFRVLSWGGRGPPGRGPKGGFGAQSLGEVGAFGRGFFFRVGLVFWGGFDSLFPVVGWVEQLVGGPPPEFLCVPLWRRPTRKVSELFKFLAMQVGRVGIFCVLCL